MSNAHGNQSLPRPETRDQPNILLRLNNGDPTAADDCVAIYGAYVSELAKNNMPSDEEAVDAVAKIFDDIRVFAVSEYRVTTRKTEVELIRQIAVRGIVKQAWNGLRAV